MALLLRERVKINSLYYIVYTTVHYIIVVYSTESSTIVAQVQCAFNFKDHFIILVAMK